MYLAQEFRLHFLYSASKTFIYEYTCFPTLRMRPLFSLRGVAGRSFILQVLEKKILYVIVCKRQEERQGVHSPFTFTYHVSLLLPDFYLPPVIFCDHVKLPLTTNNKQQQEQQTPTRNITPPPPLISASVPSSAGHPSCLGLFVVCHTFAICYSSSLLALCLIAIAY